MPDIEIPDPDEIKETAEDPFLKRGAFVVSLYAVVLAVGGLGGNNVTEDMILNQQEASNQWSYYQAKTIREAIYQGELDRLEFDAAKGAAPDLVKRAEARIAKVSEKLKEYKKEKEEIMDKAKNAEKERDKARTKDPYFDMAEVLLQVAIVLASVSMLSGRKWLFAVSIVVAIIGTFLTVNGYTLLDGGRLMGP